MVATPVPTGVGGPPPAAVHPSAGLPSQPKRRRRWLRTLIGTLVLLLVAAGITIGTWWYVAGRWVSVPDVRRDTVATATSTLEAAGFHVANAPGQASESVRRGAVIATQPPGGRRLVPRPDGGSDRVDRPEPVRGPRHRSAAPRPRRCPRWPR